VSIMIRRLGGIVRGDRTDQDVAMADVRQLVRHHPSSSGSVRMRRMPWVAATEACSGLRPVARSAFGPDSSGMMYTFGIGSPARCTQPLNRLVERVLRPDLLRVVHPQHDAIETSTRNEIHHWRRRRTETVTRSPPPSQFRR